MLFVCKCVLYYCHRVATKLQLTNISYSIHCSTVTTCYNPPPPPHHSDTLYKAPSYEVFHSLTLQPLKNSILSVVCPSEVRQGHCRRFPVHRTPAAGHFTGRFAWRQTAWCLPLFHITERRDPRVLALCIVCV